MSQLREFEGYKINDSFVIGVNTRDHGILSINLHECMALRCSGLVWSSSDKYYDKDTVATTLCKGNYQVLNIKVRGHADWEKAKSQFISLNNLAQDESKVKSIAGFKGNGNKSNGKSDNGIPKITKGDSELLGMLIAQNLSEDLNSFVAKQGIRGDSVRHAITCFVGAIRRDARDVLITEQYESEVASYKESQKRAEELQGVAIETLNSVGVDKPSKEQILNMVSALIKRENEVSQS